MAVINVDVKSLEVYTVCDLSGDKVLREELLTPGYDMHTNNQNAFGLPDRVTAKRFIFKLIYGATAYGYANDTDFIDVSRKEEFWQDVIDKFYSKYKGIQTWHNKLIAIAQRQRYLEIPSGRYFPMEPQIVNGRVKWPITKIKNYPVQGFGADLVKLARLEAAKRVRQESSGLMIGTIHDSLVADAPEDEAEKVCRILMESVAKVPELCYNIYGYNFSLPMFSEGFIGLNKQDMKEYKYAN